MIRRVIRPGRPGGLGGKGPPLAPARPHGPSGFGRDEDIRRSREVGFAGHPTKPIDLRRREAMSRQVAS